MKITNIVCRTVSIPFIPAIQEYGEVDYPPNFGST